MWGKATLITLVSRICITVMSITVTVIDHLRNDESPPSGAAARSNEKSCRRLRLRQPGVARGAAAVARHDGSDAAGDPVWPVRRPPREPWLPQVRLRPELAIRRRRTTSARRSAA